MNRNCVLFDFDGVIADTECHNIEYLARVLFNHGIVLTKKDRMRLIGTNDFDGLKSLLQRAPDPVSPDQIMEERRALGNYYENSDRILPMPGLIPFIRSLRDRRVQTGVVSSTSTRLIIAALNRMSMMSLFDVIVCGDMVERHKPEPDCYQMAMRLLSVVPEKCVIIEDSPVGIQAACRTGAVVVAYKGAEVQQDTHAADFEVLTFEECAALPVFCDECSVQGNNQIL